MSFPSCKSEAAEKILLLLDCRAKARGGEERGGGREGEREREGAHDGSSIGSSGLRRRERRVLRLRAQQRRARAKLVRLAVYVVGRGTRT